MIKRIIPALKYLFTGESPLPPDKVKFIRTEVNVHRIRGQFRLSEREAAHINPDELNSIAIGCLKPKISEQITVKRLAQFAITGEARYEASINILDKEQARTAKINP